MKEEAFYNTEQLNAMNSIQDFFDFYGLSGALAYMEKLVYYSLHFKFYNQGSPYNIVYFAECFRKILPACLILEKAYLPDKLFVVRPDSKGLPDLEQKTDYMPPHASVSWHYFPRHLNVEQYLNPMLSLKQLRKYKTEADWMKAIDELIEYSLSNATIQNCLPPYNIMKLRRILLQVIEGCYLLVIRYEKYNRTAIIETKQV